jgi:hypothetical protein
LADRDDENPQHISAEFGNLEARNYIWLKRYYFEQG